MRRIMATLLVTSVLLGLLGTASAETPIRIVIDGQVQTLAKQPVIIDGTTLVPVRGLFENLGGQVAWEPATQTVTVTSGSTSAILTVGSATALINGKSVTLNVPPQIIDGSTMVPMRVISEALGAEVHWQAANRTIDLTTRVGGTLTIIDAEPKSLIPFDVSHDAIDLIYDSLLSFDDQVQPHPGLARSYEISSDGLLYTFDLQSDVVWHDGTPFTAGDVAYTLQALLHPYYLDSTSPYLSVKGGRALLDRYWDIDDDWYYGKISEEQAISLQRSAWLTWIRSGAVSVVDSDTVRITLEKPDAPILADLGSELILPAHLAPDKGPAGLSDSPEARKPIGTGPYKFASWSEGREIKLVRNPDWRWGVTGTRPRIAEISFQFLSREQIPFYINAGAADLGVTNGTLAGSLAEFSDLEIAAHPQPSYTYLGYNLKNPLFADPQVRQAITHAIDREQLIETLFSGYGHVAHTHQIPGRWDYTADVPQFNYDPTRAAQLLDEAGWKIGPDGVREQNGVPLRFEIATNSSNKVRERAAELIRESLGKVGIQVDVKLMEWNAFLEYVDSDQKQAYILGWSVGYDPIPFDLFHSTGGWNMMTGIHNAEIDQLLEEGIKITDPAKRLVIAQKLQRSIAQEQIYSWLFYVDTIVVHSSRVKGIDADRLGAADPFWQIETWYIDEAAK